MPAHCQGCGALEGEPQVKFITTKDANGEKRRVRVEGPPVELQRIALADYGERAFCQRCGLAARQRNARLCGDRLTVVGG